MKFLLLLTIVVGFAGSPYKKDLVNPARFIATCYGYTPCGACSNCSACKHCSAGGTCGICAKVKSKSSSSGSKPPVLKQSAPGQCQATTKKGSQCSRRSRSGGYCWQHGG